jgi:hypothetical protein
VAVLAEDRRALKKWGCGLRPLARDLLVLDERCSILVLDAHECRSVQVSAPYCTSFHELGTTDELPIRVLSSLTMLRPVGKIKSR